MLLYETHQRTENSGLRPCCFVTRLTVTKCVCTPDTQIHASLTSALHGSGWKFHALCRFTSGERSRVSHCKGGSVCPRAGLDAVEKKKISCSYRESNVDSSAAHPVAPRENVCGVFLLCRWALRRSKYTRMVLPGLRGS
jgi:hypothetical protein